MGMGGGAGGGGLGGWCLGIVDGGLRLQNEVR